METLETMQASRVYTDDIARDTGVDSFGGVPTKGYLYYWVHDGGFWLEDIGGGEFLATVSNGEKLGTLEECEKYLWENWVCRQVNQ